MSARVLALAAALIMCRTPIPAYAAPPAAPKGPVVVDDRLVLELVAEQPDIVTPTGLSVDSRGRVWVIENHTHHRPAKYKGPPTDRIRIFSDFDTAGRARKAVTFAEGFKDSMGLAVRGDLVYFAMRSEILVFRNKEDAPAERRTLVKLETAGNYPHNGLCGFAFDGLGNVHFGMGENLGAAYRLVAADGTAISGGGEGGNMFVCRPDGTGLQRTSTGFWNPFHHGFDAFGRLFVVDNDPDVRGPCRLLHSTAGADFGYRFRFGRRGTHPFQCWNGELPGTLGMVAGTGEAPSGILAYESSNLPDDYRGDLLGTSWGDHTIERFHLQPVGASFQASVKIVVRGGDDFRPVAIDTAPDGTIYFSDWVDKSYPVHGRGRIWRLRAKNPPADDGLRPAGVGLRLPAELIKLLGHPRLDIRTAATEALVAKGEVIRDLLAEVLESRGSGVGTRAKMHALWAAARIRAELVDDALAAPEPEVRAEAAHLLPSISAPDASDAKLLPLVTKDPSPAVRMNAAAGLRGKEALKSLVPLLADKDPFLISAALHALGRPGNAGLLLPHLESSDARLRLGVLLALRNTGDAEARAALGRLLKDADPEIRRSAIQWVAEEKLGEWAAAVPDAAAQPPVTPALFQALATANHLLSGGKADSDPINEKWLAGVAADGGRPAVFRVQALRLLRPDHPSLTAELLGGLLASPDGELRRQAAKTLGRRTDAASTDKLFALAGDRKADIALRGDAVLGLAPAAARRADVRAALLGLLEDAELRRDALRSLRAAGGSPEVTDGLAAWWDKVPAGDAQRAELAALAVMVLKVSIDPAAVKRRQTLVEIAGPRPKSEEEWKRLAAIAGNALAGEVFHSANGPACFRCHRIDGAGAPLGPDLSTIGRALTRDRLVESILDPSREIAPAYVTWGIVTDDGLIHVGFIVEERFDSTVVIADSQGKTEILHKKHIEARTAQPKSVMPDNLADLMTPQEFADLIAYLAERK